MPSSSPLNPLLATYKQTTCCPTSQRSRTPKLLVLTFFTLSSMVSATTNPSGGSTTFGIFQLDNRTGELRKGGVRLRLQGQPLQVLSILLRAGGQVVTREELHSAIWPGQSFGDIDHALNKAIARLRDV